MPGKFYVLCEDGQQRHEDDFGSHLDAEQFAEWGHICSRNHVIKRRNPVGDAVEAALTAPQHYAKCREWLEEAKADYANPEVGDDELMADIVTSYIAAEFGSERDPMALALRRHMAAH